MINDSIIMQIIVGISMIVTVYGMYIAITFKE